MNLIAVQIMINDDESLPGVLDLDAVAFAIAGHQTGTVKVEFRGTSMPIGIRGTMDQFVEACGRRVDGLSEVTKGTRRLLAKEAW